MFRAEPSGVTSICNHVLPSGKIRNKNKVYSLHNKRCIFTGFMALKVPGHQKFVRPTFQKREIQYKAVRLFHQKGEEIQSRKEMQAVRVISQSSTVYNRNTSYKGEKAAGNKACKRWRSLATTTDTSPHCSSACLLVAQNSIYK